MSDAVELEHERESRSMPLRPRLAGERETRSNEAWIEIGALGFGESVGISRHE